ncbi:hypothetical protein [[Acholeplasma] multilocale]|uniref:hypothetical protein n=1 Tax=[Acholeplasma] multilocale TaxID=264638 RepID=UPI00047C797A|nr:hypothetical protein [[Acholeplasma] multilocale]
MEFVLNKIKKLAMMSDNETIKVISKTLYDSLKNGRFYTAKKLADLCFTSESSLTIYAKKLNFAGYRELITRIKFEQEIGFYWEEVVSKVENISDSFYKIQNDLEGNIKKLSKAEPKLIKLSQVLMKKSGNIFIFTPTTRFANIPRIYNKLSILNKKIYLFDVNNFSDVILKNMVQSDVMLFVVYEPISEEIISMIRKSSELSNYVFAMCTFIEWSKINDLLPESNIINYTGSYEQNMAYFNLEYLLLQLRELIVIEDV